MTALYKSRPARWPQFSLGGLLIVVTLLGIVLGLIRSMALLPLILTVFFLVLLWSQMEKIENGVAFWLSFLLGVLATYLAAAYFFFSAAAAFR